MLKISHSLRAVVVILCFLSMAHIVWGAGEGDVFYFEYSFELKEGRMCHVTVKETITFYEHYIGNPEFLAEYEGDKYEADEPVVGEPVDEPDISALAIISGKSSGPGSGGQMFQAGKGKYPLMEYLHYFELAQYTPYNFSARDCKTGERLKATERSAGAYIDFIIETKNHIGAPGKGDTYTLIIEYDTKERIEFLGNGRYAFSFYREGSSHEYAVSITLPPSYEYENSTVSMPSQVHQSGMYTEVHYQCENRSGEVFEFRLVYHYPVSILVEEGRSLLEKRDHSGALRKFEEAKEKYQTLGKQSELNQVNALISQCNQMEQAEELFEAARMSFVNKEFAAAKEQFENVLSQYSSLLEKETVRECSDYIEICDIYLQAQELEQQAEADIQAERWESAALNLQEAKALYLELEEDDKVSWIEERIQKIQKDSKEEDLQSQLRVFVTGSVISIGGIFFALFAYKKHRETIKPQEYMDTSHPEPVYCGLCGTENVKGALYCRQCKSPLGRIDELEKEKTLENLRNKLDKGEITKEEYQRIVEELKTL